MSVTSRPTVAVLVEAHFDEAEYRRFNEFFPRHGYDVEYVSHLWGRPELTFAGNDQTEQITVRTEVSAVRPQDYAGLILIGGYAMDRLRYQERLRRGAANQAPAVVFLRAAVKAMDAGELPIGTICHSLWLFCAAPELLAGRTVTCAHNIVCDVENAGATVRYDGEQLVDTHVDGGLVSARHPGVVDSLLEAFLAEMRETRQRNGQP